MTLHKIFVFLFSLFFSLGLSFSQGVDFFQGSWQEALAAAKKQRKLVFVDAYTVWCPPCKAMNRNTFPNAKVGEFFNDKFVSYKFDMEKGEGLSFADKYQVLAYPTLLFINFKGDVVHKAMGYKSPNELINEANKALDPAKNQDLIKMEYEDGNRSPEILLEYARHLKKDGKDYRSVAEEYFATQPNKALFSTNNWEAVAAFTTDINSREYQYLIKKQKKFIRKHGYQPVLDKIYDVLKKETIKAGLTKNQAEYEAVIALAEKKIKDKGMTANRLKMTHEESTKNWEEYAERASYHFDNYVITRPKELDRAANLVTKHIDDKAILEKAEQWARQSVAIENGSYNNETYARLLLKLGRYDEAWRYANKAIQIARQRDENDAKLQKLIEEINRRR